MMICLTLCEQALLVIYSTIPLDDLERSQASVEPNNNFLTFLIFKLLLQRLR